MSLIYVLLHHQLHGYIIDHISPQNCSTSDIIHGYFTPVTSTLVFSLSFSKSYFASSLTYESLASNPIHDKLDATMTLLFLLMDLNLSDSVCIHSFLVKLHPWIFENSDCLPAAENVDCLGLNVQCWLECLCILSSFLWLSILVSLNVYHS